MGSEGAKATDLGDEGRQHRVDGRMKGSTETIWQDELGQGRHDEDRGLSPDLGKSGIEGWSSEAVDDLGRLHGLAGSDVQPRHVALDIVVTNDGEEPRKRHSSCNVAHMSFGKYSAATASVTTNVHYLQAVPHT